MTKLFDYINEVNYKNQIIDFQKNPNDYFSWIHGSQISLTIKQILFLIKKNNIAPFRTGHLGNWNEIKVLRAGAVDHNGIVISNNYGVPFIFDTLQTENCNGSMGDQVYLPGTIVFKNQKDILDLYYVDNNQYIKINREKSYFIPFLKVKIDAEYLSLLEFLKEKHEKSYQHTIYLSDFILQNETKVRLLLDILLDYNDPSIIVDRFVNTKGSLRRVIVKKIMNKYILDMETYAKNDLIDKIILVFKIAKQQSLLNNIKNNIELPFLALSTIETLIILLQTSSVTTKEILLSNVGSLKSSNIIVEWGAFGSAGYPPVSSGYFRKKAVEIKKLINFIALRSPLIKPIFFVLLPSTVFNILPITEYNTDIELIDKMILKVLEETKHIPQYNRIKMFDVISNTTNFFLDNNINKFSNYYLSRFNKNRSIYNISHTHNGSKHIDLASFYRLSFQKACMLLGAMYQNILLKH